MKVIVGERGTGKTTELINWVKDGEETRKYPGWSRVLLVETRHVADGLRGHGRALDYHQVFTFDEWRGLSNSYRNEVEIAVDNLDIFLGGYLKVNVSIASSLLSVETVELSRP